MCIKFCAYLKDKSCKKKVIRYWNKLVVQNLISLNRFCDKAYLIEEKNLQ